MKKIILAAVLFMFVSANVFSSDITGHWHGLIKEHGIYLRMSLDIQKSGKTYTGFLDSPDQGAREIQVSSLKFENDVLEFRILGQAIKYKGTLGYDNIIKGFLEQNGLVFNVNFSRDEIKRHQEPAAPYPYEEIHVTFNNAPADITLSGTLTLPKDAKAAFAAVVLISGSGPQNRDEEIYGHKPFLVMADYLTRNGIAVLRYDDRGTALSSGDYKAATTKDLASDAYAALKYLKTRPETDKKNIGLIGQGEGAAIAAMIASKEEMPFIVLLSGSGQPGKEVIAYMGMMSAKNSSENKRRIKRDAEINKRAAEIAAASDGVGQIRSNLTEYLGKLYDNFTPSQMPKGMGKVDFIRSYLNVYATAWMSFFLSYNPAQDLAKIKSPVFAAWGEKDMQLSAKENSKIFAQTFASAGNKDVTIKIYPGLNHLFQESVTGMPSEYAFIEETFSEKVMSDIVQWIKKRLQ